jgi:hypothetical protein
VTLRAEADEVPYDPAVATSDIVRQSTLALIDALETVVHGLPAGSPIAAVLTDDYLEKQRAWVEAEPDLEQAEWPPLLVWAIAPWRADAIALLDSDVRLIRDHPTSDPVQATAWLSARPRELRKFRAGLVETAAKARALAFAEDNDTWTVIFDAPLANGRDVDILLAGPDRSYYIECTVITESDEDQQVHDEWLEARKSDPDLLLARPGPFDSATAKGPSPSPRPCSMRWHGMCPSLAPGSSNSPRPSSRPDRSGPRYDRSVDDEPRRVRPPRSLLRPGRGAPRRTRLPPQLARSLDDAVPGEVTGKRSCSAGRRVKS